MTENQEKYLHILSKVPIFSAIDRDKMLHLYERCDLVTMAKGEHLMDEGTPAEEIYVVLSGEVQVILEGEHGNVEVASWGVGHVLGEASVIGIQNHSATVVVKEDSRFLLLSRSTLMSLYSEDLQLFSMLILNIARELARRLKKANNYIESL